MSVQLVETYEEDSYAAVAQFVADLLNDGQAKTALAETPGSRFLADCENLVRENKFDELINRLSSHLDVIFAKASEKDAACSLSVIVHLMSKLEPDDKYAPIAAKLANVIAQKPDQFGDVKLDGLLSLYAVAATEPSKYMVLIATVEFAKQNKALAARLVPYVKGKADKWVQQWRLNAGTAKKLYVQLASLMKVVGDRVSIKEYLKLVTSAMALVEPKDPEMNKTWLPIATEAVKAFIRSKDIYQCDFWEVAPVQQLSKEPQHAP